ncbi:hypothetical protein [Clostridium rectalis]|uniref:hypothetical protein n=1 Tax=Clostridium rectalis TaxID=2040295 RepID=UPI000F639C60|nr:hypothetical protein [Clostridium rectalis]
MNKIFKYELKRLIINKFFLGLLIISALYSYEIMRGQIILGIANTAPFSGWSYGTYLAKVLPILLVTLLFFVSFFYQKQEKGVQVLTKATPIDPFKFQVIRFVTIIVGFGLISSVPIIYSFLFYAVNFNYTNFSAFLVPIIITLLPAMLFTLGLGTFGGQYHQGVVFVLMAGVVLLSLIPLPYSMDLFGGNFFTKYPESLQVVEPVFSIPLSVVIGKVIYGVTGLLMMLLPGVKKKK